MIGILISQVDGHETTPLVVCPDMDNAMRWVERAHTGEPAENHAEFKANVAAAETAHPRTFDIQVESGFGSWDYRFSEVNVQAAS